MLCNSAFLTFFVLDNHHQYRAGLVPIGNPHDYPCDASLPDVPPFDPETGAVERPLTQRASLVSVGNPHDYPRDVSLPDVPPFDPETGAIEQPFQRPSTHAERPCNTIDVGFRNQLGCPLHVYWANHLSDVPDEGFSCGEKFRFHLGNKPAPQNVSDS
jgi:hypothetical protein